MVEIAVKKMVPVTADVASKGEVNVAGLLIEKGPPELLLDAPLLDAPLLDEAVELLATVPELLEAVLATVPLEELAVATMPELLEAVATMPELLEAVTEAVEPELAVADEAVPVEAAELDAVPELAAELWVPLLELELELELWVPPLELELWVPVEVEAAVAAALELDELDPLLPLQPAPTKPNAKTKAPTRAERPPRNHTFGIMNPPCGRKPKTHPTKTRTDIPSRARTLSAFRLGRQQLPT